MQAHAAAALARFLRQPLVRRPCTSRRQRAQSHLRMLPNAEKVSCSALLSTVLSRFLMKMLPTPAAANGQRCCCW